MTLALSAQVSRRPSIMGMPGRAVDVQQLARQRHGTEVREQHDALPEHVKWMGTYRDRCMLWSGVPPTSCPRTAPKYGRQGSSVAVRSLTGTARDWRRRVLRTCQEAARSFPSYPAARSSGNVRIDWLARPDGYAGADFCCALDASSRGLMAESRRSSKPDAAARTTMVGGDRVVDARRPRVWAHRLVRF